MFLKVLSVSSIIAALALSSFSTIPVEAQNQQGPGNSQLSTAKSRLAYFSAANKRAKEIKDSANAMRTAKTDDERKKAEQKLRGLLDKEYDERIAGYEKYLNEMEAKLKEMRNRLQRRRSAKSDMIDLRIKVLAAEADDLGWPAKNRRFPGLLPGSDSGRRSLWAR